jgi:peptidoglycan/LPS O-acetylase OafA/YrhL
MRVGRMTLELANTETSAEAESRASESRPPQVHLAYLDGLRALAALYVVVVHSMDFFRDRGLAPHGAAGFILPFFHNGHLVVDIFIVLSGFCLMLPVVRGDQTLRGGALLFFKKRARRILPPYFLALALCYAACLTVLRYNHSVPWDNCLPLSTGAVLSHFLLVQDAFQAYGEKIDYTLWSIAVEWRIYFLFPLLVFAWRRIGPLWTTILGIVFGYSLLLLLRHTFVFTETNGVSPHYIGLFALGMFAAGISFSNQPGLLTMRQRAPWTPILLVMTCVVVAVWNIKGHNGTILPITVLDTVAGLWAAILLVTAGPGVFKSLNLLLAWRPLAFVGTFAYSIYLIHPLFLGLFQQYVLLRLNMPVDGLFYLQLLCAIPLTTAFCYLFFLLCERPFLNHKRIVEVSQL